MGETGSTPKVPGIELISVVVPVYNEAQNIVPLLEALSKGIGEPHETLLVYDFDEDSTVPPARAFADRYHELRLVKNEIGRGVLNAIRAGIAASRGDVVVVTMADLSDDPSQIVPLASMVRSGAAVAAASRYMPGGRQIGGPALKSLLSRAAGLSLRILTRIGTHDATNNFKAYSRRLLSEITIESSSGFELGLELTVKAHLMGHAIRETPTTWRDRTAGESRFPVLKWLPSYLRWYLRGILGTWSGERARALRMPVRSAPARSGD